MAEIAGSPLKQKAVAFAVFLKNKTNDSSVIHDFTIYKVHKLSGLSYKTIRKYLAVLFKMELAMLRSGSLYIMKMSSHIRHKNIDISRIITDGFKNTYNQIRDVIFLAIQARKDFIKGLLRLRKNPEWDTDFKKVRRLCKKCCNNPYAEYKEYGISYKRVAKEIGCCERTAFSIVKDALKRKWCTKTNRCEVVLMEGVNYMEVPGFTFTTENYGFILRSNTYTLKKEWAEAIGAGAGKIIRPGKRLVDLYNAKSTI